MVPSRSNGYFSDCIGISWRLPTTRCNPLKAPISFSESIIIIIITITIIITIIIIIMHRM